MPFTPFHFGPGATMVAILGRRFSFTVFAFSQLLMDLEPGVRMLLGKEPLHPHLHTYVGATFVAVASGLLGRPVCEWTLRLWNARLSAPQARWLAVDPSISIGAAWSAAVVGAYSHVLLDSIMHADLRPLAPFANGNALLGLISIEALHLVCIAMGLAGVAALAFVRYLKLKRSLA